MSLPTSSGFACDRRGDSGYGEERWREDQQDMALLRGGGGRVGAIPQPSQCSVSSFVKKKM